MTVVAACTYDIKGAVPVFGFALRGFVYELGEEEFEERSQARNKAQELLVSWSFICLCSYSFFAHVLDKKIDKAWMARGPELETGNLELNGITT